ncbi:hypothetical protein PLESTM_001925200 [Pleodorina starrii]|nr:hypothetical protein PLESTM_001925200 [Pleodorina starrii]
MSPLLPPALGANFGPFAPPRSAPLAGLSPGVLPAVPHFRSIGAPAFLPNPGCSAGLPQLGPAGQGAPPLGVASGRLARISGRLRASPHAPSAEQDMVYQRRLAVVNQVLLGALSGKTVDRQDASTAEFLDWLTRCGRGRSWADCTPDDVLVYMVTWWLPHRHGRDGGAVGPSAVKACLSALSGVFARAGRNGPYNAYIVQGRMAGMGMGGGTAQLQQPGGYGAWHWDAAGADAAYTEAAAAVTVAGRRRRPHTAVDWWVAGRRDRAAGAGRLPRIDGRRQRRLSMGMGGERRSRNSLAAMGPGTRRAALGRRRG